METPEMKESPPFFTGTVPPQWAVNFCKTDYEHLRQFHVRFKGVDEKRLAPLAGDKLTGQALHFAQAYPDVDTCRASLWLRAIESLSLDQRTKLVFPHLTESAGSISPAV